MADFLHRIQSAVVLLDADAPDFEEAALAVQKYFHKAGIALKLKAVHKGRPYLVRRRTDLFVSLLPQRRCRLAWQARASRAQVKAGRFQLRHGKVFDLVVSDSPAAPSPQTAVFAQMAAILESML